MTPLDQKLEEIQKRVDVATSGPWEMCRDGHQFDIEQEKGGMEIVRCGNTELQENLETQSDWKNTFDENFNNAKFIANSRTDIPKLLKLVKIQREAFESLMSKYRPLAAESNTPIPYLKMDLPEYKAMSISWDDL